MVSCTLDDNIKQETPVPRSKKMLYIIRVDVELLHDGQQEQQQPTATGQQHHAHYKYERLN